MASQQRLSAAWSRCWVLCSYSLMAALQGGTWSVPGLLFSTYSDASGVYHLSGDAVNLLLNYGPIFFLLAAAPVFFSLDRHGIRPMTLLGSALVLLSNAVRCLANDSSAASIALLHASYILNALAGPAAMAIPAKLAEDHFPPEERTRATAIAALSNQAGPIIIQAAVAAAWPAATAHDNFGLNAFLAALSLLSSLACALHFPSHPPAAPSASAALARKAEASMTAGALLGSVRSLLRSRPYLIILAAYSVVLGLSTCTTALLTQNITALGGTQAASGWIGLAANLSSVLCGIAVSGLADALKGRAPGAPRLLLVACMALSSLGAAGYTLVLGAAQARAGSSALLLFAVAFSVSQSAISAGVPLLFDLAAEFTFPTPEGVQLGLITAANNAVSLLLFFAPSSSFFLWANWAYVAVAGLFALALAAGLPPRAPPRSVYDSEHRAEPGRGEEEGQEQQLREGPAAPLLLQ
jgi:MFS family permease